jgi:hypothetical protein
MKLKKRLVALFTALVLLIPSPLPAPLGTQEAQAIPPLTEVQIGKTCSAILANGGKKAFDEIIGELAKVALSGLRSNISGLMAQRVGRVLATEFFEGQARTAVGRGIAEALGTDTAGAVEAGAATALRAGEDQAQLELYYRWWKSPAKAARIAAMDAAGAAEDAAILKIIGGVAGVGFGAGMAFLSMEGDANADEWQCDATQLAKTQQILKKQDDLKEQMKSINDANDAKKGHKPACNAENGEHKVYGTNGAPDGCAGPTGPAPTPSPTPSPVATPDPSDRNRVCRNTGLPPPCAPDDLEVNPDTGKPDGAMHCYRLEGAWIPQDANGDCYARMTGYQCFDGEGMLVIDDTVIESVDCEGGGSGGDTGQVIPLF